MGCRLLANSGPHGTPPVRVPVAGDRLKAGDYLENARLLPLAQFLQSPRAALAETAPDQVCIRRQLSRGVPMKRNRKFLTSEKGP